MEKRSVRLVVVLSALLVVSSLIHSCATDSATKSYTTLAAINEAVQGGVRTFGVIYQSKKAEDPVLWGQRYDKVQAAYSKYQTVALLAAQAAASYGETKNILSVVRESADEVLKVLSEFGVK